MHICHGEYKFSVLNILDSAKQLQFVRNNNNINNNNNNNNNNNQSEVRGAVRVGRAGQHYTTAIKPASHSLENHSNSCSGNSASQSEKSYQLPAGSHCCILVYTDIVHSSHHQGRGLVKKSFCNVIGSSVKGVST